VEEEAAATVEEVQSQRREAKREREVFLLILLPLSSANSWQAL